MASEEATRGAAHVLLDMLSAFDAGLDDHALVLAARRLNDVGAVTATRDDEAGVTTVDARPLISAALNLLASASMLVLQARPDLDGADVVLRLRAGASA